MVVAYAVAFVLVAGVIVCAAPVVREAWTCRVERKNRELSAQVPAGAPEEETWLDKRLTAAGLQLPGTLFAGALVSVAGALAVVAQVRFGPPGAVAAAGVVALAAELWLRSRAAALTGRFEIQLGECLPMVAEGIRGGLTFESAVRNVASYMDEPIKGQFDMLAVQRAYGVSMSQAVQSMAERVNSRDMDMLAAVVSVQSQAGGSMADVLDSMAETIQRRNRLRKHVEVVTADGRISAAVIGAIPIVVFAVLNVAAPTYVQMLTSSPVGWTMLAVAAAMVLAGLFVIRRLYRIKIY